MRDVVASLVPYLLLLGQQKCVKRRMRRGWGTLCERGVILATTSEVYAHVPDGEGVYVHSH